MTEVMIVLTLIGALVLGPLVWGAWKDRRTARGLAVRAEIQAVANRVLGGESLLSVEVTPATFWRSGRVLLSAPVGDEWMVEAVWSPVLKRVPRDYELVVKPAHPAPSEPEALRRAA